MGRVQLSVRSSQANNIAGEALETSILRSVASSDFAYASAIKRLEGLSLGISEPSQVFDAGETGRATPAWGATRQNDDVTDCTIMKRLRLGTWINLDSCLSVS